jgi:hypothetical protein
MPPSGRVTGTTVPVLADRANSVGFRGFENAAEKANFVLPRHSCVTRRPKPPVFFGLAIHGVTQNKKIILIT